MGEGDFEVVGGGGGAEVRGEEVLDVGFVFGGWLWEGGRVGVVLGYGVVYGWGGGWGWGVQGCGGEEGGEVVGGPLGFFGGFGDEVCC